MALLPQGQWPEQPDRAERARRPGGKPLGRNLGRRAELHEGRDLSDFPRKKDLASDYVTALLEDREGALWIATFGHGLKRLKGGDLKGYTTKDGLAHDKVRALLQDSKGNLWVGSNGGLDLFADGNFKHYSTADGLASNLVYALCEDPGGVLWMGTVDGGLSFFGRGRSSALPVATACSATGSSPSLKMGGEPVDDLQQGPLPHIQEEAKDLAEGRRKSVNCVAYGLADGMRSFECNRSTQPCAWKTRDGSLWFATTKGAVVLRPGPIPANALPRRWSSRAFPTDGRPLDMAHLRNLTANVREVEIRYTAPSLLWPEKVRFRYILEGYQKSWVDVQIGRERIATFTNLPPGDYTFRVKAANNDGVWNETGASWNFRIQSHFYQTAWFVVLALLATMGLVVGDTSGASGSLPGASAS